MRITKEIRKEYSDYIYHVSVAMFGRPYRLLLDYQKMSVDEILAKKIVADRRNAIIDASMFAYEMGLKGEEFKICKSMCLAAIRWAKPWLKPDGDKKKAYE